MTLNKYFLIFFFILIFFNIKTNAVENKILFKVDNDIITSIDIYKESLYLELINPNLKELSMEKIYEISKNSLIREKIKEIELRKNFKAVDVNKEYLSQLMINYSSKMGFSNENELKNYFKLRNLNIDDLKKKIRQEVLWNQLIVRKFLKDVDLDYPHGTGHGVGYFSNVHEGPQAISRGNKVKFKEGMITSNEPGYYKKNYFGTIKRFMTGMKS